MKVSKTDFLDDIRVSDVVSVRQDFITSYVWETLIVKRVTPTRVELSDGKVYVRATGREVGRPNSRGIVWEPACRDHDIHNLKYKLVSEIRGANFTFSHGSMMELPHHQLEKIRDAQKLIKSIIEGEDE